MFSIQFYNMAGLMYNFQEVIDLTEELVGNKQLTAIAADVGATGSSIGSTEEAVPTEWQVGDSCLAIWSKDGQ